MTREIAMPTGGQPLAPDRTFWKFAAVAGTGAGLASFATPMHRDAAALQATPTVGGSLNVGVAAELKVLDPHITTLAAYATTLRFRSSRPSSRPTMLATISPHWRSPGSSLMTACRSP